MYILYIYIYIYGIVRREMHGVYKLISQYYGGDMPPLLLNLWGPPMYWFPPLLLPNLF